MGKAIRAQRGGETGKNGHHYAGGQYLPNTLNAPGLWAPIRRGSGKAVDAKNVTRHADLYAVAQKTKTDALETLAGLGEVTQLSDRETIALRDAMVNRVGFATRIIGTIESGRNPHEISAYEIGRIVGGVM